MRVMVIDDDYSLLRSLKIHLKQRGHEPLCYLDAGAALDALRSGGDPHVIVVDLVLQGMGGHEFLASAQRLLNAPCKIVVISGRTELLEDMDRDSLQVSALLPKPLDLDRLSHVLDAAATWEREMRGPAYSQGKMVGRGRSHPEPTRAVPGWRGDMPRREWEAQAGSLSCPTPDCRSAEHSPLAMGAPPASSRTPSCIRHPDLTGSGGPGRGGKAPGGPAGAPFPAFVLS